MAIRKVSIELWAALKPLVPKFILSCKGRRRRSVGDRAALNGFLHVLQTGIAWEDLPQALGFGSGMTCWRRLRDWQAAGVWTKLHLALLQPLREHDQIGWSRASIDGASVASPRGGSETGPNPTDRGKLGSKRHIVVDARGIPLSITVTGTNRHNSFVFESTLEAVPAVRGLKGQPRKRPQKLHADKGYDYARCRQYLRRRGIIARIARKGIESKDRLGRHRWVVERTHAWFAAFSELRIRFERRLDIHTALLSLAAAIICPRFVDDLC
ncbi:IS5 family transposase [Pseudomonas luteola]|uniref:IS5 family transposase n=1 Tax=Pseudomonas luteola TaxID=47886 RepID=UPI000F7769AC|nr:IS5 family transposase [Pseudomonas luteola]MCG7374111.1 IS5 family transposase [Pseudomonas luteola]RRW39553.1 IS5 family transposase [Pseudomonas luteola]